MHYLAKGLVHHCCSQGTPSLLPSICVPGQFLRKNFASAHEVICEQCVLPSQRVAALTSWDAGVVAPVSEVAAASGRCARRL